MMYNELFKVNVILNMWHEAIFHAEI